MVKNLQNNKPQIHLEPSRAWIKNLGPGMTRRMPKRAWNIKESLAGVNKAKYKNVKMTIRADYGMNVNIDRLKRFDKLPTFKRVLNNSFDGADTNIENECDENVVNPVSTDIKSSKPYELSDFTPPPSPPNLCDSKLNDELPKSSTELFTNTFVQMDETSHNPCHIDLNKGECFSNFNQ